MTATARYETRPYPRSKTWQHELWKAAEDLGMPFMPWQKQAARLLTEVKKEDGLWIPRYKNVIISVPRQQGKTTLARAAVHAVAKRKLNQRLYGTAGTNRMAAVFHLKELGWALREHDPDIRLQQGAGREMITWPNSSSYAAVSPNEAGGHGLTIDFVLVDEAWAVTKALMGGLSPGMIARPQSQMLVITTMGDLESEWWNEQVLKGRDAVEDPESRTAYVEYSAPSDDAVWDDTRWHEWMPALGLTVSKADIHASMDMMSPAEIIRAYGNRTVHSMVTIFPDEWVDKSWTLFQAPNVAAVAVDVNDSPAGATVSAAHLTQDGGIAVRVIEYQPGSNYKWVVSRVADMIRELQVDGVVADFGGPTKILQSELTTLCEDTFTPLADRKPRELGADTMRFYNGLREGSVHLRRTDELQQAIAGSRRKDIGDLWIIARRKMSVDASPINSVIMAHGLAHEIAVSPPPVPAIF